MPSRRRSQKYVYLYVGGDPGPQDPNHLQKQHNDAADRARARKGYQPCPRCGKHMKDYTRSHYLDVKNKIHCLPPFDEELA